jgi:hypothetical protein
MAQNNSVTFLPPAGVPPAGQAVIRIDVFPVFWDMPAGGPAPNKGTVPLVYSCTLLDNSQGYDTVFIKFNAPVGTPLGPSTGSVEIPAGKRILLISGDGGIADAAASAVSFLVQGRSSAFAITRGSAVGEVRAGVWSGPITVANTVP